MYVNALREPSCHQSGATSACVGLSLLLYIFLYSRQGPGSSARYKRRAEGRPGCMILCTLAKEVQVWGQSTAVSSGRFLASIPWIHWMSYLVNRAQGGSLVACTGMTRAYLSGNAGTGGRPAWRRTSWRLNWWLVAGGKTGKREVCKGRETRPKLTDAAKHL